MFTLLPNELWDYDPVEAIRGLRTAVLSRHPSQRPTFHLPGLGPCVPVRSARAAIVLALKALALPAGASVAVPLYCCPVVFKAIKAAGCRPRFVDIDPETYCLSPADLAAKSPEVDAVIAVHMFGNLCDMPRLREAAAGKPLIEDCAQALGSRLDGRAAGSYGDVGAFSFRLGKYLSVGEGGAVCSNQADLMTALSELISELPVPARREECAHVANTLLRSMLRTRPLWGLIGSRLWDAYNRKVSYTSQSPLVLGQTYQTDLALTIRRLRLLDTWIAKQRSNADYYSRNLNVDPAMLCSEFPGAFYNRLQYPLLLPTSVHCDRLAARLRESQITTGRPYRDIAAIAAGHYGYAGDCPRSERVAERVLVIPCNHALSSGDVERVATCLNRAWAAIRGAQRDTRVPCGAVQ